MWPPFLLWLSAKQLQLMTLRMQTIQMISTQTTTTKTTAILLTMMRSAAVRAVADGCGGYCYCAVDGGMDVDDCTDGVDCRDDVGIVVGDAGCRGGDGQEQHDADDGAVVADAAAEFGLGVVVELAMLPMVGQQH